jgi:hypothetical protein
VPFSPSIFWKVANSEGATPSRFSDIHAISRSGVSVEPTIRVR